MNELQDRILNICKKSGLIKDFHISKNSYLYIHLLNHFGIEVSKCGEINYRFDMRGYDENTANEISKLICSIKE